MGKYFTVDSLPDNLQLPSELVTAENTVGIDLGTTFSTLTYCGNDGQIHSISESSLDGSESPYIPSYVSFVGKRLVGNNALRAMNRNSANTIYDSKRFIGKHFSEESVQNIKDNYPFQIVEGDKGRAAFLVDWQNSKEIVYPEQVYSMIITYLCGLVKEKTNHDVKYVSITVPAAFNGDQRRCTMDAVRLSGKDTLCIISEPVAAAISFTQRNIRNNSTILVYDLGGGTFDVSIIRKEGTDFKVLGADGDSTFGGRDLDQLLYKEVVKQLKEANPSFDPSSHKEKISNFCEKIKIELSRATDVEEEFDIDQEPYTIYFTYDQVSKLFSPLLNRSLEKVQQCMNDAKLTKEQIDHVVLIGGSSNWPDVKVILQRLFGNKILDSDDPRLAVSMGAYLRATDYFNDGMVIPTDSVVSYAGMVVPVTNPNPKTPDSEPIMTDSVVSYAGMVVPVTNTNTNTNTNPKASFKTGVPISDSISQISDSEAVITDSMASYAGMVVPVSNRDPIVDIPSEHTERINCSVIPIRPDVVNPTSKGYEYRIDLPNQAMLFDESGQSIIQDNFSIYFQNNGSKEQITEDRERVFQSRKLTLQSANLRREFISNDMLHVSIVNGRIVVASNDKIEETKYLPITRNMVDKRKERRKIYDILPLPIGIDLNSGSMGIIVNKGASLPATGTKLFRANAYSPTKIVTKLYQGDDPICSRNHCIGLLEASGLHIGVSGRAEIVVTVTVDEFGCVEFSYHENGRSEVKECKVFNNVALDKNTMDMLQSKLLEWEENNRKLEDYDKQYAKVEENILKCTELSHGDPDGQYAIWKDWLKLHRVAVASDVTAELKKELDDLDREVDLKLTQLRIQSL